MQDKPLDKIIDSLGGKKKGRKRKKKTTPTPMSEVEFFNAIKTTSKSTGFDQEKLESISETKEVSYEKDFSELKEMVQKVLSKNTSNDTKFKKIDPRDIKKLDKYTFKTAVIKTEKGVTQLPALRTGGVVTSPTQALIGENGPEAVVPLEKLQSLYDLMPNISREGFGTLVRRFMPNADYIQVDSLYDRVRNRRTEIPQFGIPEFDPSRGESYLDVTNPVEAVRSRGRPRVEEMESLQEYRAKLDRIFENTHRDQKPLLKTDKELQRERFERNRERRRDRGQILNLFKIFDKRDDLSPEIREQLLESAKSINPEIFRQIERDRGFEEDDRKMQERMEYVRQPGKDLRARREKIFADREKEAAEKEKRKKEREERLAKLEREQDKNKANFVADFGTDYFERKAKEKILESDKLLGEFTTQSELDRNPEIQAARARDAKYVEGARRFMSRREEEKDRSEGLLPGFKPAPRGKELQEELIMIRGEERMKEFSEKMAALQEMREKYRESRSGREQTSQANTPRVQPSNPAKVKTPTGVPVGVGGGGGGMGLFDVIGMAMQAMPLWRSQNG